MKTLIRAAAVGALLVTLFAAQAGAQTYPMPEAPTTTVPSDEECVPDDDSVDSDGPGTTDDEIRCDEGDVLPNDEEAPSGAVPVGAPGGAEGETAVLPASGEAPAAEDTAVLPASAEAPSGALPITGGDVLGIAAIGAAAVAIGTALVRRSRSVKRSAA